MLEFLRKMLTCELAVLAVLDEGVALHVSHQVSPVFEAFATDIASLHSIQELLLATIVILELLLLLLVILGVKHVPYQVRHRDAVEQGLVFTLLQSSLAVFPEKLLLPEADFKLRQQLRLGLLPVDDVLDDEVLLDDVPSNPTLTHINSCSCCRKNAWN